MARSARLERRIDRDFPDPGSAPEVRRMLDELIDSATYDPEHMRSERIQAAIIVCANGDIRRLQEAIQLTKRDWRDLLVAAGLAHEDWPSRLHDELGPDESVSEPAT